MAAPSHGLTAPLSDKLKRVDVDIGFVELQRKKRRVFGVGGFDSKKIMEKCENWKFDSKKISHSYRVKVQASSTMPLHLQNPDLFQSKNSSSHTASQELQALSPMTLHQKETLVLLTRKSGASICKARMSMNQGLTKMAILGIERVEKTLVKMDTDADGQMGGQSHDGAS